MAEPVKVLADNLGSVSRTHSKRRELTPTNVHIHINTRMHQKLKQQDIKKKFSNTPEGNT